MGQSSKDSVRKTARGVQSLGLTVQWVFAVAQPDRTVNSFSLCKRLISLLLAICQPAREGCEPGTNVGDLLVRGDGSDRSPVLCRGSGGLECIESCPAASPSPVLPEGTKRDLELTPFTLSGMHGSLLK